MNVMIPTTFGADWVLFADYVEERGLLPDPRNLPLFRLVCDGAAAGEVWVECPDHGHRSRMPAETAAAFVRFLLRTRRVVMREKLGRLAIDAGEMDCPDVHLGTPLHVGATT